MNSEALSGRVVPLPMRCIDGDFNLDDELAKARRVIPSQGVTRRSLVAYPDLRIDVVAFADGGSLERPWPPGRVVVQCLQGFLHITTDDREHELCQGEIFVTDGRLVRAIVAFEESALMATIPVAETRLHTGWNVMFPSAFA